jgi:Spx/MgsR family transcriptional regulator
VSASRILFYQKPSCSTCRKAKAVLLELGIEFTSRDLDKQKLSAEELDRLIGKRDYRAFLNTRNVFYRELDMYLKPPSRADALKLMAKVPNLIRRPVLIYCSQILIGFDELAYRKLQPDSA